MSEIQKVRKVPGEKLINILFFALSIVIVDVVWKYDRGVSASEIIGSTLLVSSCYTVLFLFLLNFRSEILKVTKKTFFIILTILAFIIITRLVSALPVHNLLFLVPFAIIPIVILTFYDARLALFILLITLMLAGFMVQDPFEFVFMNFISGVVAIYLLSNINRRAKQVVTSVSVFVSYSIVFLAVNLLKSATISDIAWSDLKWFAGNGLLIFLIYPLIFLVEKRFNFLSDTTLLELSYTSQPLLRRLAEEAPGSFQHSLQVANLAEEAARAAGANHLLARTGALYHDVGKMVNPGYFIENQKSDVNPHMFLNLVESSRIIINHVSEGVLIARKYKLPVQIIDFIRTHHGTTKTYFFYRKYLNSEPGTGDMEKEFAYPGPKPFSKEMAIVMMADAVEASSRTLEKHTEESISELVERIILMQEQEDQFSDVPLTFKNISDIKNIFKKRLSNIYHPRISYA